MKRVLPLLLVLMFGMTVPGQTRRGWRVPDRGPEKAQPLEWGPSSAAHLMRRAGFSASKSEIDRIVQQGFDATLEELLNFETVDDSAMEQALAARNYPLVRQMQNGQQLRPSVENLQRWWLYRMINSRRQLLEKMTLFWHDHFATSVGTVRFVNGNEEPLVLVQNETLRQHALGNFKQLVLEIARDPAMIIWLNNFENVKGRPNENWARELLELFTMGEGNGYTEVDIQEAARAFTGWSLLLPRRADVREQALQFVFLPRQHDEEAKTVLGQTFQAPPGQDGVLDGEAVIDIIFQQPQVAEFIARKAWEFFVYPEPEDSVIEEIAATFRDGGYEIKPLMRAIFEHPNFMSSNAYRSKIKSPVEYMVGVFRETGIQDPQNLPRLSYFFGLGQDLFAPPDVGGWTADRGWINTGTILARNNFLTFVTSNRTGIPISDDRGGPRSDDVIDLDSMIEQYQLRFSTDFVDFFVNSMIQGDLSIDSRYQLELYMDQGEDGLLEIFDVNNDTIVDRKVRGLIFLIGLLPVYQLN